MIIKTNMNLNKPAFADFLEMNKHKKLGAYKGDIKRVGKYSNAVMDNFLVGKYKVATG